MDERGALPVGVDERGRDIGVVEQAGLDGVSMDGADGEGKPEDGGGLEREGEDEGVEGEVGGGEHLGEQVEGLMVPALLRLGRQVFGVGDQPVVAVRAHQGSHRSQPHACFTGLVEAH